MLWSWMSGGIKAPKGTVYGNWSGIQKRRGGRGIGS
jgi:hypothetical protein